jgi:hypothetical protein
VFSGGGFSGGFVVSCLFAIMLLMVGDLSTSPFRPAHSSRRAQMGSAQDKMAVPVPILVSQHSRGTMIVSPTLSPAPTLSGLAFLTHCTAVSPSFERRSRVSGTMVTSSVVSRTASLGGCAFANARRSTAAPKAAREGKTMSNGFRI